jgi:hypothetical protein
MNAADYNKRELEQGRLTWEQLAVVCEYADVARLKTNVKGGALSWARITECVTTFQRKRSLSADGKAGETTRARIKIPLALGLTNTVVPVLSIEDCYKPWDGPAVRQPRNRAEVIEMFGDPGTIVENKAWTRKHLVECHEKNGNRLPGVPAKWWVSVHRVVEPYLRSRGLRTIDMLVASHDDDDHAGGAASVSMLLSVQQRVASGRALDRLGHVRPCRALPLCQSMVTK